MRRSLPALATLAVLLPAVVLLPAALHAQFPRSTVDPQSAERGAKIYGADCARCHGDDARGTATAPDMIRSTMVLHDRREMLHGSELGPYLKSTAPHAFKYNAKELGDLSQFLTQAVNKILRSGYDDRPTQLLSGDAKLGEAYFNGPGGCSQCHSVTGDMAHIGKKYSAAALQQKYLFPSVGLGVKKKIQVTVTLPGGRAAGGRATGAKSFSGDLVRIDDFTVALRDKDGVYRSFNRTAGTQVKTEDPYAAHTKLLDTYTDADIHNLTTYLDTLQ